MNNPKTLMIDKVQYVRADSLPVATGSTKIVVLDRGFVFVGKVHYEEDFVVIRNAYNIRIWGTTKGLGELAQGPTNTTKLDKAGTITVPYKALIFTLEVEEAEWNLT
jgi:hypothetical protein